ncbi:hypothetical protein, conserved [Eimeria tenella]|uniref:Coiled-coil domain-containing protein 153 n=1 Tax=Eimeria tenella TaxID=5802 RepID=U6L1W9_EIMTE|nr:hypothetical protein, conserved [Eimeria tenella]CDJ43188.1 hypothetical protein, conserved [Eimeria tenella]|eukprot:XP_013233938.1 hypothetical protein, conserved [Eimeria tenella]
MSASAKKDEDRNYELENEVLRRRIQTLDKLLEVELELREKSERASAGLRKQIEDLNELFSQQDKLLFSSAGNLSQKISEAKTHYQQLIQNLQQQLQAAERDVAITEEDVSRTRSTKEKELQKAKQNLQQLEGDIERMTFQFADLLNDTAEKLVERISMSQGSWAAEQKRKPLELRMQEETPIDLGSFPIRSGSGAEKS